VLYAVSYDPRVIVKYCGISSSDLRQRIIQPSLRVLSNLSSTVAICGTVKEKSTVADQDTSSIITHSFADRRSGVDTRSEEERQRVGERRSGLDRRQITASRPEDYARQALQAASIEEKINCLAQAIHGMAVSLTAIERRLRVVQQNTSDHGF
jgi:hypothetical protein